LCVLWCREIYVCNMFDDMCRRHVTVYLGVMLQVINGEIGLVTRRAHKDGVLVGCVLGESSLLPHWLLWFVLVMVVYDVHRKGTVEAAWSRNWRDIKVLMGFCVL
jgi:hypothetical protein